jgi:hypothetical protein
MTEQQPPPGMKLIRGWFGEPILVVDPDVPPPGHRYAIDFNTGKRVLVPTHSSEVSAIEGLTSAGHDSNIVKVPNLGPPSRQYFYTLVPVRESGNGIDGITGDPTPLRRVNGDPPRLRDKNGPAIFG